MSFWSRIGNVFRSERLHREIDEELQAHLSDALEQGRDPAEARRAFGSALRHRENARDIRVTSWLDSLRADTIFGWRQIRKNSVTSAAAVLSLGLAIGACTSAFRLIDAMLLRPLPIAHPERLYGIFYRGVDPGGNYRLSESSEYPLFERMRVAAEGQADLLAISYVDRPDITFGSNAEMERVYRQYVSGSLFAAFGLRPAIGRLLTPNDDLTPGAHPHAVLSYDYWTRRFHRDPDVIGRTFRIENRAYEIVGVLDDGFTGTETGTVIDFFVPTMMHPRVTAPDSSWFRPFAYLKPGISPDAVRQRLDGPFHRWQEERAKTFTSMPKERVKEFLNQSLILEPSAAGASGMQRANRVSLFALSVLVALVLLIACANVTNLMNVQAATRSREMALRVSIGAGRGRLVQLVLVESACLAFLAAAVGGVLAWWSAPLVVSMINPTDNPARLAMPADWRVLAFGTALALAVTIMSGLLPALRASAVKPARALKGGEDPHARRRSMHTLIALQVAFCFLVLFVSGLFVASFDRLSNQPTGFSSAGVLAVNLVAEQSQPAVLWEQAAAHLRAQPGVEQVGMSAWPLLSGNGANAYIWKNGVAAGNTLAMFLAISPDFFDAMRIPVLEGRLFQTGDVDPAPVVVNQSFVKMYFPGQDPIGKRFERSQTGAPRFQIAGVVRDVRYSSMREPIRPTVFIPMTQERRLSFLVRTNAANPMSFANLIRREVPKARPEFRVSSVRTQEELIRQHTVRERLLATLALFFSAIALLLAAVGLYGVLDYSVLQRRREIGIRMAIGAQASDIARRVTQDVFAMVTIGAAAGLGFGLFCVRYIDTLLYQVKPSGLSMWAVPALTIFGAAFAAALPAVFRAVRLDPAKMLRSE